MILNLGALIHNPVKLARREWPEGTYIEFYNPANSQYHPWIRQHLPEINKMVPWTPTHRDLVSNDWVEL